MDSAGYQRRLRAVWSEEIEPSKETRGKVICSEINTALLIRTRSRTEGQQSSLLLSHITTRGGLQSSNPWSSNQDTSSAAQGDIVE